MHESDKHQSQGRDYLGQRVGRCMGEWPTGTIVSVGYTSMHCINVCLSYAFSISFYILFNW